MTVSEARNELIKNMLADAERMMLEDAKDESNLEFKYKILAYSKKITSIKEMFQLKDEEFFNLYAEYKDLNSNLDLEKVKS